MVTQKEKKIVDNILQFLESQGIIAFFGEKKIAQNNIKCNLLLAKVNANLQVQIFSELSKHQILNLIEQKTQIGNHFILLCGYLSKPMQEFLRQQHINFIDCSGSMYIELDEPQVLYCIINTQAKQKKQKSKEQKLASAMSIMLLYLLEHKTELNQTVRKLASTTKLSNDTVQKTKDWLKTKRYIILQNEKEYIWNDWKAAYQRWLTAYEEDLRPKNLLKTFDWSIENQQSSHLPILSDNQFWTGEAALLHQTLGLKNIVLWEIYTKNSSTELMKELRIIPQSNGNVKVYHQFWQWKSEKKVLSPLLIYADLLLNLDARIQELSKKYEHDHIKQYY
jgi:hypothetical protein